MLILEGKKREEREMTGHFLDAEESRRNTVSEHKRALLSPSSRSEKVDGTPSLGNSKLKKSQNP